MIISSLKTGILCSVMALSLLSACHKKVIESAQTEDLETIDGPEVVNVGVEVDEWGCRPSAGYQWSKLKLECVRPFEIGIPLIKIQKTRPNSLGFLIFDEEHKQAELYLPELEESLLLDLKVEIWTDQNQVYRLKKTIEGFYELYSAAEVLLYKSVEKE